MTKKLYEVKVQVFGEICYKIVADSLENLLSFLGKRMLFDKLLEIKFIGTVEIIPE